LIAKSALHTAWQKRFEKKIELCGCKNLKHATLFNGCGE